MDEFVQWLSGLEWYRLIPETVGKALGFLLGIVVSWFLLFRRQLQELRRFQQGESNEILFQMHKLVPVPGSPKEVVLVFRNVGPKSSINVLYENTSARELVRRLADSTSMAEPVLSTEGTPGFEIINDALGHVSGYLSLTPFDREIWLFMMTCEDRKIVRKRCIRCFLIKPHDLERFADWQWCATSVRVEKPWHAYRILALHSIAHQWDKQRNKPDQIEGWKMSTDPRKSGPTHLAAHDRIRLLSVGLHPGEQVIGEPVRPIWKELDELVRSLPTTKPATEGEQPKSP